jgi:UDP-glucose 4-epimerase
MIRHGVRRLVFSSSAAIYGNPQSVPIDEGAVPRPTNPYGEAKLIVERMLAWMNRAHGLRYACLRYFNVAGAASPDNGEDHRPESHLIPLILKVALGQSPSISIFGTDYPTADGTCVRDYVHVADLASAHLLALDALDGGEALHFNVGNGDGFSVREVVEMARRITGHPVPVVEQPRRPGDPAILVASARRIREQLGWKPRHADLESIVASAWEWHRRHPNGYAD